MSRSSEPSTSVASRVVQPISNLLPDGHRALRSRASEITYPRRTPSPRSLHPRENTQADPQCTNRDKTRLFGFRTAPTVRKPPRVASRRRVESRLPVHMCNGRISGRTRQCTTLYNEFRTPTMWTRVGNCTPSLLDIEMRCGAAALSSLISGSEILAIPHPFLHARHNPQLHRPPSRRLHAFSP